LDFRVGTVRERPLIRAILISLLLHLMLLSVFVHRGYFLSRPLPPMDRVRPERQIAFEIVETPEAGAEPPEQADLLSDKQSVARDLHPGSEEDQPFSEGFSGAKYIQQPQEDDLFLADPAVRDPGEEESSPQEANRADALLSRSAVSARTPGRSAFSRDRLVTFQNPSQPIRRPVYDQREGGVPDFGGMRLNTYAWDYAPYLLELKRRIEKNIFPPPVFTRMGFGGHNVFRFRIMPDGSLAGSEMVDALGEPALIATSENAIKFSVPFKPLPRDFPESYLEITARFEYMVTGQP